MHVCAKGWGTQQAQKDIGDAQEIPGELAAGARALSLSLPAMSAGPDSNPFEGLLVLTEC